MFPYYEDLDSIWNGIPLFDSELISPKLGTNYSQSLLQVIKGRKKNLKEAMGEEEEEEAEEAEMDKDEDEIIEKEPVHHLASSAMNGVEGPDANKQDDEDPGATIDESMEDIHTALSDASQVCFIILILLLLTY